MRASINTLTSTLHDASNVFRETHTLTHTHLNNEIQLERASTVKLLGTKSMNESVLLSRNNGKTKYQIM